MLDRISANSVIETFRRFGFSVHQTSDSVPKHPIRDRDVSDGYTYWDDLKYWADEAGIDREQFED